MTENSQNTPALAGGKIRGLDHYNLDTTDEEATLHFYVDVLGLVNAPQMRPAGSTRGTWILIDGHPAIHVNFVEQIQSTETGPIDHIAFDASGYVAYEEVFKRLGIEYRKNTREALNLVQLFVQDPNGIKIEINIRGEL